MRVLFWVEPLVMHSRPHHYWAWLGYFARMLQAVEEVGGEGRIVTNEALAARAIAPRDEVVPPPQRGWALSPERVVALEQEPIRRLFGRPNIDILAALHRAETANDRDAIGAYGDLVKASLGGFVPDVVVTLTPASHLADAFPDAVVLASETAAYSRAPLPSAIFFDPGGLWDRSVLGGDVATLHAIETTEAERDLAHEFRRRFAHYFRTTSPFGDIERELRARFARVGLLPLQFAGESGFDTNAPFRSQGEYLFHVLERLPADVGLLVVEHPTAHWVGDVIDDETRAFVAERFPNVAFVDFRAAESSGQLLVHHVDFVVSVSSSIALQGLLFGKPLVAVGGGHLPALASVRGLDAFPIEGPLPPVDPALEPLLGWLVTRYFPPIDVATDPAWLHAFFARSVARHREGVGGPAFFDPIDDPARLRPLLFAALDAFAERPLRAKLANGDFADWDGAFPEGWDMLDVGESGAELFKTEGPPGLVAAAIARSIAGSGPTLFLQRVPDVTAFAGALVRIRFQARAEQPMPLAVYVFMQTDDGLPGEGAEARIFVVESAWREHTCVARLPRLGAREVGPGNHTEVVFAVPQEAGAGAIAIADVHLEAVHV